MKSSPNSIESFQDTKISSVVALTRVTTGVIGIERFGAPGIIIPNILVREISPALVELTGMLIVKLPTPPVIC